MPEQAVMFELLDDEARPSSRLGQPEPERQRKRGGARQGAPKRKSARGDAEQQMGLRFDAPAPSQADETYLGLLREVRNRGTRRADRTGTGTLSLFGYQMRFDLEAGFPLLTSKRVHWPSVAHELLWFVRGDSNLAYLHEHGVSIWDEWADAEGELGPVYGVQWRSWPAPDGRSIDQLAEVVERIRREPESRRLLVSAWNPADLERMALPPCHTLFQFYVSQGRLSCQLYQRSADVFLGLPFNIASYALLTHLVAHSAGLSPGEFVHTLGDTHLYLNHLDQADEQLSRLAFPAPRLRLDPAPRELFEIRYEHLKLENYRHHPGISAPVAV